MLTFSGKVAKGIQPLPNIQLPLPSTKEASSQMLIVLHEPSHCFVATPPSRKAVSPPPKHEQEVNTGLFLFENVETNPCGAGEQWCGIILPSPGFPYVFSSGLFCYRLFLIPAVVGARGSFNTCVHIFESGWDGLGRCPPPLLGGVHHGSVRPFQGFSSNFGLFLCGWVGG